MPRLRKWCARSPPPCSPRWWYWALFSSSGRCAISGHVSGNLAISVICGVTTFVVLLILGMPYAAPLALLVAVLDLIPLVGATLGGALLVIVGLFVRGADRLRLPHAGPTTA